MEIRPFRCDLIHWQTEVAHRKLQSSSISFQASEKYSSKIVTWHRIDIDQKKEREREWESFGRSRLSIRCSSSLILGTVDILHLVAAPCELTIFWLYGIRAKSMRSTLSRA